MKLKPINYEELKNKNLHPVLEGHGVILKSPKVGEGVFGYGTHTCSLLIIEGEHGELGLTHIHERIGEKDLQDFLNEFGSKSKIYVIGGSNITQKLIENTLNKTSMTNYHIEKGQYDALIYKKDHSNNYLTITEYIPKKFKGPKIEQMSQHIKNRLYINLLEAIKNRKTGVPLIVEYK